MESRDTGQATCCGGAIGRWQAPGRTREEKVFSFRERGGREKPVVEVVKGQFYVQNNAYRNVWEVKAVLRLANDMAHARLARVDEPSTMKTIACAALADDSMFEHVDKERSQSAE